MNRAECYKILELPIGASKEELKQAHRKLAMKWHPDRNRSPEAEEMMKKVNVAYETLSQSPTSDDIFNFGFRMPWNMRTSWQTSLTINLENPSDANKIIALLRTSGFKIKGYSISSSGVNR